MIDLTSRTIDEINGLIQKYTSVLELYIKQQQYIPYLAVIIDVGVKHIKEKHADLPLDWKVWSIIYIKNKYFKDKIPKESDIPELIDEFIGHYKEKYGDYINDLGLSSSEFDRDYGFVRRYI
jgi:hypothetical protein